MPMSYLSLALPPQHERQGKRETSIAPFCQQTSWHCRTDAQAWWERDNKFAGKETLNCGGEGWGWGAALGGAKQRQG